MEHLPARYCGKSDFVFDAEEHIAWLKKGEEEERAAAEEKIKEQAYDGEKAKEKKDKPILEEEAEE